MVKLTVYCVDSGLEMQHCDDPPRPFSFLHDRVARAPNPSVVCHMTRTSPEAHQIVLDTLHLNVHLKENVTGPRYTRVHLSVLCLPACP